MSGLRDLAAQATPGPWKWHSGGYFDSGEKIVNLGNAEDPFKHPVLDCATLGDPFEADARLIALAPELAVLCADMADELRYIAEWVHSDQRHFDNRRNVSRAADALLARFAALNTKAGA